MPRKLNDPLRELLEFVKGQIQVSAPATQERESMQELMKKLKVAIQDLKRNPGPSQTIGN